MAENHLKVECPICSNLVFPSELEAFGGWCKSCSEDEGNFPDSDEQNMPPDIDLF